MSRNDGSGPHDKSVRSGYDEKSNRAPTQHMFDDLTDIYEALIDWPKRLAHEGSFYRRWFQRQNVHSVVDVACGTGHHAAMFHSWNLRVEGADLSPAMIDRARANFGEPAGLRWVVRGFDAPIAPAEPFDAAVCVGNSLALAPDAATAHRAIEQMAAAVRSGGLLVVHLMNLGRLPDGPCVWQKCRRLASPQGELLVVKGVHRCGAGGYVDFIVAGAAGAMQTESVPLLGLEATELESVARTAGASDVHLLGGYDDRSYDRQQSVDLLVVARKH
jgi:SAM-dependent methyltransferase